MKLKKVIGLVLGAAIAAAMSVSAFAAEKVFPATNDANNDQQKGWIITPDSEGVTLYDLAEATYLVLELDKAPVGGMQIVCFGDGNGWAWGDGQTDKVVPDEGTSETTLVIELASLKGYTEAITDIGGASTQVKFYLCYYSDDFDDLGLVRAYLTDTAPGAVAETPAETTDAPKDNVATGSSATALIFGEIAAVAALALAVMFVFKKAKN